MSSILWKLSKRFIKPQRTRRCLRGAEPWRPRISLANLTCHPFRHRRYPQIHFQIPLLLAFSLTAFDASSFASAISSFCGENANSSGNGRVRR